MDQSSATSSSGSLEAAMSPCVTSQNGGSVSMETVD